MTALTVTGLDLSLTGTGIAHIRIQRPPTFDPQTTVETLTITSTGKRDDAWPQRAQRLRKLRNAIVDHARHSHLVVVEGPAYGVQGTGIWDRAGHFWNVVGALDHLRVPYAVVEPKRVKKFATDNGNSDKAAVAAGVTRLWGELAAPRDNNQFDALALASLGAIRLARRQLPIRVLERHMEVVSAIGWPSVEVYDRRTTVGAAR